MSSSKYLLKPKRCANKPSSRSLIKTCNFDDDVDDEELKLRRELERELKDLNLSLCGDRPGWIAQAAFSFIPMEDDHVNHPPPQLYIRTETRFCHPVTSRRRPNCNSSWYLIPAQHLQPESPPPKPKLVMGQPSLISNVLREMPSGTTLTNSVAVALPPRIYVLGGGLPDTSASPQVFSYDTTTTTTTADWERRPNMLCARVSPSTVALDGKIYVFGGLDRRENTTNTTTNTLPYAEVYDPESDRWEGLLLSAGDVHGILNHYMSRGHALFMDQYNNKHLLVQAGYELFTYDISADSFTRRDSGPEVERGAVVDDILYCYMGDPGVIIAYDLRKAQWFSEPVRGLRKGTVLPDYHALDCPLLTHIGNGRLCITHGHPLRAEDCVERGLLVRCSVVRVTRVGQVTLVASLESYKQYVVPGNKLQDCLVL